MITHAAFPKTLLYCFIGPLPIGYPLFLAEKERFELSRRLIPTYTLSRGASSANLSTSPYLRIAVFQIRFTIITYFILFVNIFFYFFTEFLILYSRAVSFLCFLNTLSKLRTVPNPTSALISLSVLSVSSINLDASFTLIELT